MYTSRVLFLLLSLLCIHSIAFAEEIPNNSSWQNPSTQLSKNLFELAVPEDSEDYGGKVGEMRTIVGGCAYDGVGHQFRLKQCLFAIDGSDGGILSPLAEQFSSYLLSVSKPTFDGVIYWIEYTCSIVRGTDEYHAVCSAHDTRL